MAHFSLEIVLIPEHYVLHEKPVLLLDFKGRMDPGSTWHHRCALQIKTLRLREVNDLLESQLGDRAWASVPGLFGAGELQKHTLLISRGWEGWA